MLMLEEVSCRGIGVIALDGRPASSTTSTRSTPLSALGRYSEGDDNTLSLDGNPLGVTVVRVDGGSETRPSAWAVICVSPGVVVVVTLATAYSRPGSIETESGTLAILVCEEERNTVMLDRAAVGRLAESSKDTTMAG